MKFPVGALYSQDRSDKNQGQTHLIWSNCLLLYWQKVWLSLVFIVCYCIYLCFVCVYNWSL